MSRLVAQWEPIVLLCSMMGVLLLLFGGVVCLFWLLFYFAVIVFGRELAEFCSGREGTGEATCQLSNSY